MAQALDYSQEQLATETPKEPTTLADAGVGVRVRILRLGGERAFRRRLMELGFLPGTEVEVLRIAPLRDPLELLVRGCSLSIRREEARQLEVSSSGNQ